MGESKELNMRFYPSFVFIVESMDTLKKVARIEVLSNIWKEVLTYGKAIENSEYER